MHSNIIGGDMRSITDAEAALLGLLSEAPAHPYQLEKTARDRDMRLWTDLSMSSIYKLLRKLEKAGYAGSEVGLSDDNRARKVYRITQAGADALAHHLAGILSEPEWPKWRVDIAIYNLDCIDPSELGTCLDIYRRKLQRRIEDYEALVDYMRAHGCAWHRLELPRRVICLAQGELRWLDELHERLENESEK